MLTYAELLELQSALRDTPALSVYIDGRVSDPAARLTWRTRIDKSLATLRSSLADAPADERRAFDLCLSHLTDQLPSRDHAIGARGWVAFVTADGVRHAGPLPVSMPPAVYWETGAHVAPYVRALKQHRPVIVAIVDQRCAKLYRYQLGALEALETVHSPKRGAAPEGARTEPPLRRSRADRGATVAEERMPRSSFEQLLTPLVSRLTELMGDDGWLLLGGTQPMAKGAQKALPPAIAERSTAMASLSLSASAQEIERAATRAASEMRSAAHRRAVADIVDHAAADGMGALGVEGVRRALDLAAVETLYVSQRFAEQRAAEAEPMIDLAMEQGAHVETVSGAPAEALDGEHDGVCARLRFSPYATVTRGEG